MFELIPEELRQAHEDGGVVFFCGAGVSVPAGLCSFADLTEKILVELAPDELKAPLPWKAFREKKYDETLDILERHEQGGFGQEIRDQVQVILDIKARTLGPHKALIRLANLDKPEGRLVTTNFDPLFEKGLDSLRRREKSRYKKPIDIAPALPPPKIDDWNSLVYLHGRLGHSTGNRGLVLTTADFGAAYLLDRWASRFVTELFRTFYVVFIGYSVEDPTMRYLVSALAAARDKKEHYKEPFAFASFGGGNECDNQEDVVAAWKIKGVRALPYDNNSGDHHELWEALEKWASNYRGGLLSRRRIAVHYGRYPPTGKDDAALSELAWALKDAGVSKYIAELQDEDRMDPGWISLLHDKGLLNLPVGTNKEGICINAPLVSRVLPDHLQLHNSTFQLGCWIARCLDRQETLNWVLEQGGVLHRDLRAAIQAQLKKNAAKNIEAGLVKIWEILATDNYAHALSVRNSYGYPYFPCLSPEDIGAQRDFLDRLRPIPVFVVRPGFFSGYGKHDPPSPFSFCEIKIHLVGIEGDHDVDSFKRLSSDWDAALAAMADEITTLLHQAMDWQAILELAGGDEDTTDIDQPSISSHEQNSHTELWVLLIGLARDSFDALQVLNVQAAERLAHRWMSIEYPVFRRLALYSVTGKPDA